jgi:hypothetical protein
VNRKTRSVTPHHPGHRHRRVRTWELNKLVKQKISSIRTNHRSPPSTS